MRFQTWITCSLAALGVAVVALGGWFALHPIASSSAVQSAAMTSLLDTGRSLERDIARVVQPAVKRTRDIAADPRIIAALRANSRDAQTQLINSAITSATEIDAIALFDAAGHITAINTVYTSGAPIAPDRVQKILGTSFDHRDIIQTCVQNASISEVLEFQTTCDITPAFFDSTGLSIAYSVPIVDPATGDHIGVASSRMRFDRLTDMIKDRAIDNQPDSVQFVTDAGKYFSEAINSGSVAPPIPTAELAQFVRPALDASAGETISFWHDKLVTVFPLRGLHTLKGGGVHVMLMAPASWVTREAVQARRLQAGAIIFLGLLLLLVASMSRALALSALHRCRTEDARAVADAASIAKSRFLANMSHEIRTPMTAILGYAELLEGNDQSSDERQNSIRVIRRNGEHLLRIINDILDLSKIEAGKMVLEHSRCSLCNIVAEVAATMRVRGTTQGVTLDVQYLFPVPETIQSDPLRVRQILVNLIGNAIKFTHAGHVIVRVRSDALAHGESHVAVEVEDSGIGMSPQQLDQLFQPFTQADGSTTRKYGGTGLGLTISRRFAQMLGGDIAVSSTPGKGSLFTLTLATGSLEGVRMIADAHESILPSLDDHADSPPPQALAGRILLAEDGPDNQRLISHLLQKAGAEVEIAEHGRLALEAAAAAHAAHRPFDLILMDMQMPEMDGYEAVAHLRARGETRPIIALTAHAMNTDREKCLAAGCTDFATKPIDRRALLNLCHHWLTVRREDLSAVA